MPTYQPLARFSALLLAAGLSATLPSVAANKPAPAEVATFEIGTQAGQLLSPGVLGGHNFGNWMQVGEYSKQLNEVHPTTLRFPGGNVGDEYDMTADVLTSFKNAQSLLKTSDAIIHTRLFATSPVSKNKPEDAAEAVSIALKMGIKPLYWEVGNEPDLFLTNRADKTWTPARYCENFRAQRKAILAVDPTAKFAGPAVSGALPARDDYIDEVIKGCGDVIDMLTWHIYPTDGGLPDEDALDTANEANRTMARFRDLWKNPKTNPLGYTRKIEYGVTEYGLSWNSPRERHIGDQIGALWAAEIAIRLAEEGAQHATYFALQATMAHGLLGLGGEPRPTFYAYKLLDRFRGQHLSIKSNNANLWVHAAVNGKQLAVSVTNRGTTPIALDTALPGWKFQEGNAFEEKTVKDEAPFIKLVTKGKKLPVLPPHSMGMLIYTAE